MRIIFLCLIFVIINLPITAQQLMRKNSSELLLQLDLSNLQWNGCPNKQDIQLELFQKVNNEAGHTCSQQNIWKSINKSNHPATRDILIPVSEKGVYRVDLFANFDCESVAIKRNTLKKLLRSNVYNDYELANAQDVLKDDKTLVLMDIYPNPSSSIFNIQMNKLSLDDEASAIITVHANDGKQVLSRKFNPLKERLVSIDLSQFPAGSYFFSLKQNNQLISESSVVKINK